MARLADVQGGLSPPHSPQPSTQPAPTADVSAALAEARACADVGDFDRAHAIVARAIDAAPNDAVLHAAIAWYGFRGRAGDAAERDRLCQHHMAVAFEIDPGSADAHYYQGRIWMEQGLGARARVAFESALKARPGFEAAQQAMARLVGTAPAPDAAVAPDPSKRARPRTPLGLVIATVLTAIGGVGARFVLDSDGRELASLAKQLGTPLPIRSAGRADKQLRIDVGAAWSKLAADARAPEMAKIAQGAAAIGFDEVFLYAESHVVAESHGGQVCTDPTCLTSPVIDGDGARGTPPKIIPGATR
jgi:hypothetical protein